MLPCVRLPPLRIAIAVDSGPSVPAWVGKVIGDLQPAALVLIPASRPLPAPPLLFRQYTRWDARHIDPQLDPLQPVALPQAPGSSLENLPPGIDILLWLSSQPPALSAQYETWTISHSGLFAELVGHRPVTTVRLVSDRRGLLAEAHTATEIGWSLARQRIAPLWKAARLPRKALQSQTGENYIPSPLNHLPANREVLAFARRNLTRTVTRRLRYSAKEAHWFVAWRPNPGEFVSKFSRKSLQDLQILPAPPGHFYADPFVLTWSGRTFLYVEDYLYQEARGILSVLEFADGHFSPAVEILNRPYHLSYPFVFEHDGEVFMIPETMAARRIELYRAIEMPHRWELVKVLQDNLEAVDTTLWVDNGIFYFFTNIAERGLGPNDLLFLFTADSLTGDWRPHPRNPISLDVRAARGAGKLFRLGSKLIRPAQDCSVRYGYATQLNEVEVLSPEDFREKPLLRIEPDWAPNLIGTHTINSNESLEVLDGQIYQAKYKRRTKEF